MSKARTSPRSCTRSEMDQRSFRAQAGRGTLVVLAVVRVGGHDGRAELLGRGGRGKRERGSLELSGAHLLMFRLVAAVAGEQAWWPQGVSL
ncbi:hypothetical protein GCM10010844_18330 [Deinococcus radiotolerans]|uniref:Uncharacterized protein n=1 Tax=Deinococcus radiotolerans TaxID=1309407 RepID=A0ABQ2FKH7_9DEIO|nr:hypothetical protein GCM10010844_18330 [Deinococcus radiotolerans]